MAGTQQFYKMRSCGKCEGALLSKYLNA